MIKLMKTKELTDWLKTLFPATTFYTGAINSKELRNVGVFLAGSVAPNVAIGGYSNTSYSTLPVSIMVHWSEDSDESEEMANSIYQALQSDGTERYTEFTIVEGEVSTTYRRRIVDFALQDSSPRDLKRDSNNICEYSIRVNVIYEREAI